MQSEIILLGNVKQDNIASLVQKEFEMFGITGIKGKRIDADRSTINKTVSEALADYNVIMVIGGMGEKDGNMSVSAVASAVGFPAVDKDGEIFPEGAEIFRNRDGKPSGCAISQGNQCIIMLPGDTETLPFMLCHRVSKYMADFVGGAYSLKTLRAVGISKSEAEEAVSLSETEGTTVRVFEDKGEICVQIYAKGENRKDASEKVSEALKNVAGRLGNAAYAVDAENVGQAFGKELSKKDLNVAVAVSGIQRDEISAAAYTNEFTGNYTGASFGVQKYNIPEKLLKQHGENSTWTAAVLAGEVCKAHGSNIGIAVTADKNKVSDGANIAVCMGDNVWTEHIVGETYEELVSAAGSRAVHLARNVVFAYPKLYENSVSLMAAVSGKSKFKTAKSEAGSRKWYSRFIPMKGDSKTDLIRKIIFLVSVAVFIGSMAFLGTKVADMFEQDNLASEISGMMGSENYTEEQWEEIREWGYNPDLYELYTQNNDTMGYIKIDNTNIDFVVVQTEEANDKGEKGQFYLRKDFKRQQSMYGTPFLDYRCNAQPEIQSKNLIVYGHNVYNDGKMFSDLIKYRQLKFYKEHPVIHFNTLYGNQDWLVVGVILTNAYEKDGPVWNYNNFINGDDASTAEFLNQVAKRTMIVTGVDYNTTDDFLTLSTCSYDFKDARVVIIAREVREGEDISNLDTSKAYYNANPVMPDKWYQAISEAQKSEADASFGEAEEIPGATEITGVDIISAPDKLVYNVGETVDTTGLVFEVVRADGTTELVSEGYTVTPTEPLTTPGNVKVTIEYQGTTFSYYVEVLGESSSSDIPATSIEIVQKPNKLEYFVGEYLNVEGLIIRVHKEGGTYEDVFVTKDTEGVTYDPDIKVAFNSAGDKVIKVFYKGFEAKFNVRVTDKNAPKSIAIITQPTKLNYTVGEVLDTTGMVIEVTKNDGTKENITTGFTTDVTTLTAAGEITVTVTYQGLTATFKVTVAAASSDSSTDSSSSSSESSSSSSSGSSSEVPSTPEPSIPEDPSSGETSTASTGTSPYYKKSKSDKVKINGTSMSVYDAVCQIVTYEAGSGQPDEHVKAQAVASYTYVMNNMKSNGNVNAGVKTNVPTQIEECVAEVIGYAVLDDRSNDYILATYFSESCGETADAEWVWGYANRNLKSVSSPVDGKTSKTYTISSSDFADKVYDKAGITLSGDPANWVRIQSYWGSTDYVNMVKLGNTSYSARKLRETVLGTSKLRSTAFDVTYNSSTDSFTFTMRGYGHGVGMSAVGSIAYAKKGYGWEDILLKYYSNCYIDMKY